MAFSWKKTFTTDHTQCGTADSTDFPITIWVTDADLKTVGNGGFVQNSNGYDIRPYADSSLTSALTYELVFYDGVNGILEMHVKVTTLNHLSDVVYYLAFGDTSLSTDGSSTATWSNGFLLVAHLPNGTSLTALDSTGNGNNGTIATPTASAAQLDGGATFNGTSDGIAFQAGLIAGLNNVTISVWGQKALVSERTAWGGGSSAANDVTFFEGTRVFFSGSTANQDKSLSDPWVTDAATHVSVTRTTTAVFIYKNGSVFDSASFSASGTVTTNTTSFSFGKDTSGTGGATTYFRGWLDEIRVANVARDGWWITAEYNNQVASSTFLAWGTKTPVTAKFVLIPGR